MFHLAPNGVDYAPEMEPDEIQAYDLVHSDKTSIVHKRGRRLGFVDQQGGWKALLSKQRSQECEG